jgi:hypothetical protein
MDVKAWFTQHKTAVIAAAAAGVGGLALLNKRKANATAGATTAPVTYNPNGMSDTTTADLGTSFGDQINGLRDQMNTRDLAWADSLDALRSSGDALPVVAVTGVGPGTPTGGGTPAPHMVYPGGRKGGPPKQKLPPGTSLKPPTVIKPAPPAPRPTPPKGTPTSGHATNHKAAVAPPKKKSPAAKPPVRFSPGAKGSPQADIRNPPPPVKTPLHKFGG